ncbi:MAG TPA: hypothetical protein VEH27_15160 [Methylomirabilota bacterium]|nr:hypothetical protein [Methylomirabilota bacterium]
MNRYFSIFALLALSLVANLKAADPDTRLFENSVVSIEVSRRVYDYIQPWSRRVDQINKFGAIIGKNEILTTADHLGNASLVRVQKHGRGKWWKGEIKWVDYHANLALLGVSEEEFWEKTQSLKLIDKTPTRGPVYMVRWLNGLLEVRNEDINRMRVKPSKLSFLEYAQLEVESEISGTGWAEVIIRDNKIVGLTASKEEQSLTVIPASFIRQALDARKSGTNAGFGYFAFVWTPGENPATLRHLGLKGDPRGVVVLEVPPVEQTNSVRAKDIVLEVDGFEIDIQGDYIDPEFGALSLENLSTRKHKAGDVVKIKVLREGKEQTVEYKLPKADYDVDLVPSELFDQEPEYVMMGGFLFVPLTEPFLKSWGGDFRRRAPFRLSYFTREKAMPGRKSLVVMSAVLPDPFNIGYQDLRYLVVEQLNGKTVRTLADLVEAQNAAKDGVHVLEFRKGESVHRVVLDAGQTQEATARTMEKYGLVSAQHISTAPKTATP